MSYTELLPTIQSLPRPLQWQLFQFLSAELARGESGSAEPEPIVLRAEDQCPYGTQELAAMRAEEGGRPLTDIRQGLGWK